MILTYLITLVAATAAALALVAWRVARLVRGPRPATGRLLNEWTWTLMPLLVLGALLWRAIA